LIESFTKEVYKIVESIPKGTVSTYQTIAILLGKPRSARAVGFALNNLKKDSLQKVPWQRVINSKGRISLGGDPLRATLQRKLLESEGIIFNSDGQVDFEKYGWQLK
jgi:methylated-DNA-protein-cysteine methyltransferase related protein